MNGSSAEAAPALAATPWPDYAPPAGSYDEVFDARGVVRPTWQRLLSESDELAPARLVARAEQVRRSLRENGVNYTDLGAPQGPDRPWELDPIPLVLSAAEWEPLADAICQRAQLLNLLLADVYGPQSLVARGLLPPALVHAHPRFLRSCHGTIPHGGRHLHLYAAHLARDASGRWLVLADRTQGPSGTGYALENRLVISRSFPGEFQRLHVERLAGFFSTLQANLRSLAPRATDDPRVVLLSPGPRSATYFEDGYLARYLGYPLVEGGDLTVRGTHVYLKTLGGLVPVDVILRRLVDEDCDPLEFRPDSDNGVTGLMQAVRCDRVSIANALGSGWLEAPALAAYLPAICRALLGEELRLPSAASWWCGHGDDLQYVEEHLSELVIRPAFVPRGSRPILAAELSRGEQAELMARIRQRPENFVAQTPVTRSTAPVFYQGKISPSRVGLRAFAAATADGYQVMPGGLCRVSSEEMWGESTAAGEGSKDVWIVSDRPVPTPTLLRPPGRAVELRRGGHDLPSRVADNLYWLGRHTERIEGFVRHLRSIVVRLTSDVELNDLPEVVLIAEAVAGAIPGVSGEENREVMSDRLQVWLLELLFNAEVPDSLPQMFAGLKYTLASLRDRLSVDCWRIVNELDLNTLYTSPRSYARMEDVIQMLGRILELLAAFYGLTMESMTRGLGWRFLDMGRRIERGYHMAQLLERTLVNDRAELVPLLEILLEIGDSAMTYRYRYLTSLQMPAVLDLLVVDETNPRAIAFQVFALAEHVRRLTADLRHPPVPEAELIREMQANLRLADVDGWCESDSVGHRGALDRKLEQMLAHFSRLSDLITAAYLTHTGAPQQLTVLPLEPST